MSSSVLDSRIDRWRSDLLTPLANLYPEPERVAERLLAIVEKAYAARCAELHELDARRQVEPDWFQLPSALGYAAYADRYAGTLRGVEEHVDHLVDLGVTYLHLMPLLQPRPAPNDGGYAVQDYRRRARRPRHDGRTSPLSRTRSASAASRSASTWCSTTSPRSTPGPRPPGGATSGSATTSTCTPTARCPTPTSGSLPGGLPRLRAGQLHLGRRRWAAGSGRPSTTTSGTSTGPTPTSSASSPRSSSTWPMPGSRCSGSTRSRSCGSGSARTARTSRRSTISPRCCARWPGSRPRPWCSRPRRSSARTTCRPTSGSASTPAR